MERQKKIDALRKVIDGAPIEEVFPPIKVTFIETGDLGGPFIKIEPHDCFQLGSIPRTDTEAIVAGVKEQNPLKRVEVSYISKEQYDRISARLEEEY